MKVRLPPHDVTR